MASKRAGKLEQRSAVPVATQAREHCADVSNGTPSAISNVQFACESMLARFQHLELAETNMCKLFHSRATSPLFEANKQASAGMHAVNSTSKMTHCAATTSVNDRYYRQQHQKMFHCIES
eukprot:12852-Heterococcus_DN1.PRE.2